MGRTRRTADAYQTFMGSRKSGTRSTASIARRIIDTNAVPIGELPDFLASLPPREVLGAWVGLVAASLREDDVEMQKDILTALLRVHIVVAEKTAQLFEESSDGEDRTRRSRP